MENIKIYTHNELLDFIKWFDDKELPASIRLDKATYIPDVKETLKKLIIQAEVGYDNPKTQGSIFLLERLKSKLTETQK